MKRYGLILMALLAAGGCAPSVRVDVTAYRAANRAIPSPVPENSVAIVTASNRSETLLMDEVAAKIAWLMEDRGYTISSPENAVYLLRCWYSMDPGQVVEEYERPVQSEFGYHYYSTGYSGYHWATAVNMGRQYTFHCKQLNLTIYDKASYDASASSEQAEEEQIPPAEDAAIWQCTAGTCNDGSDIRWNINHLLLAAFEKFGEDTSRQKTITIKEDNERFEQLSSVKP